MPITNQSIVVRRVSMVTASNIEVAWVTCVSLNEI
jgi:hypothetical protein